MRGHAGTCLAPFEIEALDYLLRGPLGRSIAAAAGTAMADFPWLLPLLPPVLPPRPEGTWKSAALALGVLAGTPGSAWAQGNFAFEWDEGGMVAPAARVRVFHEHVPPRARRPAEAQVAVIKHHPAGPAVVSQEAEHLRAALKRHAHRSYRRGKYRVAHRNVAGWRYVVKPGDSLWRIASRYLGSGYRWREVWALNRDRVRDPDLIRIGQTLRIGRQKPSWYMGHRRVGRSFYAVRGGVLVWADTGGPVRKHAARPGRVTLLPASEPGPVPRLPDSLALPARFTEPARPLPAPPPEPRAEVPPPPPPEPVVQAPEPDPRLPVAVAEPQEFRPSPWAAAGLSAAFPGAVQWSRGRHDKAMAFGVAEAAALGTIAAGYFSNSREIMAAGTGILVSNHILAGVDAYIEADR